MIFEGVTHINNKDEFNEKILVYIRLVEVLAEREGKVIPPVSTPSTEMISEMIDMGVINMGDDILSLKKIIGGYYCRFLSAIAFYLSHKTLYGDLRDERKFRIERETPTNLQWLIFLRERAG